MPGKHIMWTRMVLIPSKTARYYAQDAYVVYKHPHYQSWQRFPSENQ
jgi:hypothetical protein